MSSSGRFFATYAFPISRNLLLLLVTFSLLPSAFAQGRVDCNSLSSHILHRPIRYCVLLPPAYESGPNKKFPALYFLHGLGENEQTLLRSGLCPAG